MNKQEIEGLLDEYTGAEMMINALEAEKERLVNQVLTPEIREKLDEIEAEFSGKFEIAERQKKAFAEMVKSAVVEHGQTVKGGVFSAVWSKPRVNWDTKMLEGFALTHPEIITARKTGEPSVSIRINK